jgi:hypothetical protein
MKIFKNFHYFAAIVVIVALVISFRGNDPLLQQQGLSLFELNWQK